MKIRHIIIQLQQQGGYLARWRGSHRIFKNPYFRHHLVMAGKPNQDLPKGILHQIYKRI